ncbi:antichymotrypsin-2-like [Zophobas morio]|uniref:antichymotrypsin-2-like n=1 Tax=Zophobas morio TaxID=2755281 RepID=UPI00308273D6
MITRTLWLALTVSYVTGITPQFVTGTNLFTASIYKEAIKDGNENLLVSPLSVEVVLALAQSGAKGETAEEIRSNLHLPNNAGETKTSFKQLLQTFNNKEIYSLHTANKIYVGKNFAIKNDFKTLATDVFLSDIENIDFGQSVQAANTINGWVEGQTNHKIKDLVDSSGLSSGTPAIMVNALYFQANWTDKGFHEFPSLKRDFHKSATEVVEVDTMTKQATLNYYENTEIGATFLELPFQGGDAHMVLVLPTDKQGLADVEKQAEKVFKAQPFRSEIVEVTMPLFKIESKIDFKKILQKLGVRKAFNLGQADFSGISGHKGDVAVDGVLQKTYINVNEDGVEAAAATRIWFYTSGSPTPTKFFNVDHPFIFYIKANDVILFAGRVLSPSHENLGVSKMFTNEADLSGIVAKKGDLIVGEVVQKTFIDVNEEGVEAAAAMEVFPVLGFGFMRGCPREFTVDRPFIFYIKVRGVVLFAGRVVEPKQ